MDNTSDSFCIIPWIHMMFLPNGNVYPCCLTDYNKFSIGNLRKQTFKEIWNSTQIRELRIKMLKGDKPEACAKCHTQESLGFKSSRQQYNEIFSHHIDKIEKNTDAYGFNNNFQLLLWDLRFTNLCNYKCRHCYHGSSSSWYDDQKELNIFPIFDENRVIHVNDNSIDSIENFIKDSIDSVERIYFSGGEPLLMDEHFNILDKLIDSNRTNVSLVYTTNLSKLTYKNKNVLEDYWKKFNSVSVTMSLDGIGEVGEYIRSGTRWNETHSNIEKLTSYNPDILGINITVMIYNLFNITEIIDYALSMKIKSFNILASGCLTQPAFLDARLIPDDLKQQAVSKFTKHANLIGDEHISNLYNSIINFLNSKSTFDESTITQFKKFTSKLDSMRKEDFTEVCPELKNWYNTIKEKND